jgi:hypothetical protein
VTDAARDRRVQLANIFLERLRESETSGDRLFDWGDAPTRR